jgi:predicted outer membrane repeat protein
VVIEYCGPINAGIYSEFSENILVQNTIIRNIIGIALELREGTDYVIRNCTFEENLNNISSNQPSFANLDFFQVMDLDNFLSLSSGGLNIYSMATVNALIEDSVFVHNTASNIGLHRDRPPLLQLDGHGGAVYVRLRNPNNSNIVFRNTVFDSNGAQIDGGAVYLSMSSGAGYNSIRFDNCSFYNNSVIDTSGGAISVVLFNASVGNEIAVQNCVFEGNSAHGGGAIGIVVYDVLDSEQNPDSVVIRNSTFRNNRAVREGSAVGIFSLLDSDTSPFEVLVHNSTFEDNEVGDLSVSDGSVARAAVSSFRFPIKFTGTNRFSRNIGGGLSVVDSLVTVAKNSHLIFEDNVAHFGGGLQQVGSCLVVVSEGAVVDFVRNRALILGGAIMVNSPVVDHATNFLNRFCFIRFSDPDVPPQSWLNVSINFINNTAKVGGAALYGTDLRRCSWFNISVDNLTDYTIFTPPANVSVPFVFSGNYITDGNANQIFKNGSLGTNAVATNISFLIEKLIIQPGESVTVNAVNIDRFGNSRSGVASVELIDSVVSGQNVYSVYISYRGYFSRGKMMLKIWIFSW